MTETEDEKETGNGIEDGRRPSGGRFVDGEKANTQYLFNKMRDQEHKSRTALIVGIVVLLAAAAGTAVFFVI